MWSETDLLPVWYDGQQAPSTAMRVLAALYGGVTALRRLAYRRGLLRSHRVPVPVVVVGNITAGGTGKTPLTIALVQALAARGWQPGVVSRGHGGRQTEAWLLDDATTPERVGDEPCLMHQAGCARVAVGRDRPAAARLLIKAGADVVIADDGLQHYALARDLEICVIDGARRLGNGRLLPAGPLREPPSRLQQVDWRVCNGGEPRAGEIPMQLAGGLALRLDDHEQRPLSSFAAGPVHAVAGIGNPARFFDSLRAQGLDVIEHPFPDHHAYRDNEIDFGDGQPVLMTDKDAVKCHKLKGRRYWRVPVAARLPPTFIDALDARLQDAVRS